MKRIHPFPILAVCAVLITGGCAGGPDTTADGPEPGYSKLWGWHGEFWLPSGRLPDFSYAGYRNGEQPIPDHAPAAKVTDFGARGDDDKDDTAAFKAAIEATKSGAILVPPGRYIITDVLKITRSGVALRGAGAGKTTLYFPKALEDIAPDTGTTTSGRPTSNYSWSGGMIRLQGDFRSAPLTTITGSGMRGTQEFTVANPERLSVGQTVEIRQTDTPDNTLADHLYMGDGGDLSQLKGKTTVSLVTKIAAINGDRVTIERWLRCDLRPEWKPEIRAFEPTLQDSGVEDLTFEFPPTRYEGHFTERGQNPLAFVNAAHCWARRIRILNADSGPMVGGVFNTVSDAVYDSARAADADGQQGHHGIYFGGLGDHLFERFDFRMKFVHDISVSHCAGVVVSNGRGEDLCLDHHRRAPYEILFTQIDMGKGTRPWKSGGGAGLGKHAAARLTLWNVHADGPFPEPPKDFAAWTFTTVGVDFGGHSETDPWGRWREVPASTEVSPANIHDAQLARRLYEAALAKRQKKDD